MDYLQLRVGDIVARLRRVRTISLTVGIVSALILGLIGLGCAWLTISALDMGLGLSGVLLRVISAFLLVAALAVLAVMMLAQAPAAAKSGSPVAWVAAAQLPSWKNMVVVPPGEGIPPFTTLIWAPWNTLAMACSNEEVLMAGSVIDARARAQPPS